MKKQRNYEIIGIYGTLLLLGLFAFGFVVSMLFSQHFPYNLLVYLPLVFKVYYYKRKFGI